MRQKEEQVDQDAASIGIVGILVILLLSAVFVFAVALVTVSLQQDGLFERRLDATTTIFELEHGFVVTVCQETAALEISHTNNNTNIHNNSTTTTTTTSIWKGCPGCFVQAAIGAEDIRESRGSFWLNDNRVRQRTATTTIVSVRESSGGLEVRGALYRPPFSILWFGKSPRTATEYQLDIFGTDGIPSQLSFDLHLIPSTSQETEYDRVYLLEQNDHLQPIFGFGEQFSELNFQGQFVTIMTSENGIARGQPGLVNCVGSLIGVNGEYDSTYAPAPFYMMPQLKRGFFLENYEISQFDMRREDDTTSMSIKVFGNNLRGRWIYGAKPLDILESYTEYTGRMDPLPEWLNRGAVVGMQGGTDKVLQVYDQLSALDTPMAAFWLQDWVGRRQTTFGSQLWWNWDLNEEHYPGWFDMVATLEEQDVRVMTYISPFLVEVPDDYQGERLYDIAKEKNYFVRDENGDDPYLIGNTDFSASLIDLTNPEAHNWMKEIIVKNVIGVGASGWMADFGEALPIGGYLNSGESGLNYHNQYPEEWARLNKEAIAEANRTGDIVFFTRSGYTKSPDLSTLFWEGDQMVTWDEHDGLKSAITGLISSGLSGFSLNHNDIGGFTTLGILRIVRSRELLMRWIEMNAFTAVYRTHEGIQPEENVQFYTDDETLAHFAKFAKVYAALSTYRMILMEEASEKGYPVVRHPFLHFPNDSEVYDLQYQWMLGSEIMVAPVVDKDQESVDVYLPGNGNWTHIWTQAEFSGGSWYSVDAPLGMPPVFFQTGSAAGKEFLNKL